MNRKTHAFDYPSILKYILIFLSFILFSHFEKNFLPYSVAAFATAIYFNSSLFITPLLFVACFVLYGKTEMIASAIISALFIVFVKLIYKKFKATLKFELSAFTSISMLGYIFLGGNSNDILKRITVSVITGFITALSIICVSALSEKGLKIKFRYDESFASAVMFILLGVGVANAFSPLILKGLSVFIVLFSCYLFRFGIGTFISGIVGISLSVYYGNIEYVALTLLYGITADSFKYISRYLSAVGIIAVDYLSEELFSIYGSYSITEYLPIIIGAVLFCVIPTKPLENLKDKLFFYREKQMARMSINRNRIMLSNKLYELSAVFTEMSQAFTAFKNSQLSEEKAKISLNREIRLSVCSSCKNKPNCPNNEKNCPDAFSTLLDIGFAKGKLSLIDMPNGLTTSCIHSGDIIFGLNKMLSEYRSYSIQNANLTTGRELIAKEAEGVSEILKNLALDSGSLLKYKSRLEKCLFDQLLKNGFYVSELLIYGENENTSLSIILSMKEFSLNLLLSVIFDTLKMKMALVDKTFISEDKVYLSFSTACDFDAVFGLAKAVKDGSNASGDTHSVIRIDGNKFMVALSDGMGSGEKAENLSSVSLSLIESFYKAGMDSQLILTTVNKLLSVNLDESFTALDVSIIDLKNCSADFIKYGSPYGFIVEDGGVKIIEGNTLPLGILDDLKPAVCKTSVKNGDIILLITDGISDAFGSSGDIIDFLRKTPALNPQSLADNVLNKAVELSNGKRKDDMTALAVRIFKKSA